MKYCRFELNGGAQYGLVEQVAGRDAIVRVLLSAPEDSDGDVEGLRSRKIEPIPMDGAHLLPSVRPSKIVCVGFNYREHTAELKHEIPTEPLLFFKPISALLAPGGVVRRPKISQRVDYEGELGVVIAKKCHLLQDDEDVRPYILGYTCVNDVTMRDIQKKENQWARAKGFDTSCPVGPIVVDGLDPWTGVGVGKYEGLHFPARRGDSFYLTSHDASPRGSDCNRYSRRGRPCGCWRCDGNQH